MMLGKGDVVKLKSGHIKMIVAKAEQIGEQTVVNCVWFDQDYSGRRFPSMSWTAYKKNSGRGQRYGRP